ncbi:GYDIA family GHMP kinase [Chryseobacterium sp.]|uniref:GYDIA family GHMP kinase n=1 Tax=Chryseobacterium sp. TaxID=1871047 RepID=UPI0011CC9044|nr:GYDIA family GHMP kinase [Chryseobacterium sp.]TXF76235.1 30S ribosomal protein S6 [Chryseobacterium sp.]
MGKIFSPGKLLLTSEYVVLDGALALAVPTQLGQEFFFEEFADEKSLIRWEAFHQGILWLKVELSHQNWEIITSNLREPGEFILKVLQNAQRLSGSTFQKGISYHLKTNLQFPADYGLGSSSTLMNNLAEWANVDPYRLNELSLGGSGYDIAVAREKAAVLYQNLPERKVKKINFSPEFRNELLFIHLNRKQNSREGINLYKSKEKSKELVEEFSSLTLEIIKCETPEKFSELMEVHEQKLSDFLGIPTVKEKYFADAPVFVKSLGAWGGDFVLTSKFPGFKAYFRDKGFSSVFAWSELVL